MLVVQKITQEIDFNKIAAFTTNDMSQNYL